MRRSGVEESGRRGHIQKPGQGVVKLDCSILPRDPIRIALLTDCESHRHTHPEQLWCFEDFLIEILEEIPVVKDLGTEILEQCVTLGIERAAQLVEIEFEKTGIEAPYAYAHVDVFQECVSVGRHETVFELVDSNYFFIKVVEQKPGCDPRVQWFSLDSRADRHDDGLVDFTCWDSVVNREQGVANDSIRINGAVEQPAAIDDRFFDFPAIESRRLAAAFCDRYLPAVNPFEKLVPPGFANLCVLAAIENVRLSHVEIPAARECLFDDILDILNTGNPFDEPGFDNRKDIVGH